VAQSLVSLHGPQSVFIGMILESTGVPVPSEVLLPFAGVLVAMGRWSFPEAVAVAWAAQVVGSLIAYGIGYAGGRPVLALVGRLVGGTHVAHAERWFHDRGHWAVFWGRFLPVVRTYISFPAGISAMPLPRFLVFTVLGSLPWTAALIFVGMRFGMAKVVLHHLAEILDLMLLAVVIVVALQLVRTWARGRS